MPIDSITTQAASAFLEIGTAQDMLDGIAQTAGQGASQYYEWAQQLAFQRTTASQAIGVPKTPVYRWKPSAQDIFDIIKSQHGEDAAKRAFDEWVHEQTWGTTPQGAAGKPPKIKVTPQTAIKKPGAATSTAGGLLSVSLPTWAAAVAPLLGVALGVGLYKSNPNFWYKISQALLPWAYDGTDVMPVVTDENGNTLVSKEAVEQLKRLFENEGIGSTSSGYIGEASLDGKSVPYGYGSVSGSNGGFEVTLSGDCFFISTAVAGTSHFINTAISLVPFVLTVKFQGQTRTETSQSATYTYNGQRKTFYFTGTAKVNGPMSASVGFPPPTISDRAEAAKTLFEGAGGEAPTEYPEGTSPWGGTAVDPMTLPVTKVHTDPEDETETEDYIPVAMPEAPGESLPEDSDITEPEDEDTQVSPYVDPAVPEEQYPEGSEKTGEEDDELGHTAPIPLPFPTEQSDPDPSQDPSEPPEEPPQRLVDIIPPIDIGDIPLPSLPTSGDPDNIDGGIGGMASVYNPTYSELQAFTQWLWVTYSQATIEKIWNNPFDGVISLHELYATPNKGARKKIKSGFLTSPVECVTIPNRYSEIDCGTGVFPEYYGNYLDYSPYSKALCYLPFIGIVELNPDDIIGHAVNIKYRVDSYSGACIAMLTCAREGSNAVLYQFGGNCSVQMPIAGGTQAAIKAAQLSAAAYQNAYHTAGLVGLTGGVLGGLGSLLSGNLGGALGGLVHGLGSMAVNEAFGRANAISQTVSAKSSVQHSGQFGESFGAMGAKKPYMIIKRPVQVAVPNYQNEYGYPAHKYVTIGECEGYLRCRGVHVKSARATDSEKEAIENLLKNGVFVT